MIDLPQADYARFKAFCAARRMIMQAEPRAFIEQQIADLNVHLAESPKVPLSSELKAELKAMPGKRPSTSELLIWPRGFWG
jgi:hypothetical protein